MDYERQRGTWGDQTAETHRWNTSRTIRAHISTYVHVPTRTCARARRASPHSTSGTTGTRSSGSQAAPERDESRRDGIVMQRETSQWPDRFAEDELPFRVPFPSLPLSLSLSSGFFYTLVPRPRRSATFAPSAAIEIESCWPER